MIGLRIFTLSTIYQAFMKNQNSVSLPPDAPLSPTCLDTLNIPVSTRSWRWFASGAIAMSLVLAGTLAATSQTLRVPGQNRWLEVQQIRGSVTYVAGGQRRPARVGDRLQQPSHGVTTAGRSSTTLTLDTSIGVVQVAENTNLRVREISTLQNGGRVTLLTVDRGQARLQVRRFNNPDSRLEIQTPSGVAAVRGTDFGISVDPEGKTGVATETGSVAVSAEGVEVMVNSGFGSSIEPGEPPTPPRPIDRVLFLELDRLQRTSGRLRIRGHVDPLNTVLFEGQLLDTNQDGEFSTVVSVRSNEYASNRLLTLTVRNPLGDERNHFIDVPEF